MAPLLFDYWHRLRGELEPRSFALVGGLALVVSTQILFHPHLLEMWDLADVARAWFEYLIEVMLIGAALLIAIVAVEQTRVQEAARWTLLALALAVPALCLLTIFSWMFSGRWWSMPPTAVLGQSVRYTLLGAFLYAVRALRRRAQHADQQARDLQAAQRELERQAEEAQLRLLQAQIEPHFLFNTLANVRRLYRKQPLAGGEAIDNLMTYLRAALPGVRRMVSTLAEEFELAQAYLELFKVRMGRRLRFRLDLPPALRSHPFPPMVLVTLVENAIKHGLAPADLGGTITIEACLHNEHLEVTVCDDGVGFGAHPSGSGVGLVNIRRQLAARFGDRACLTLEQQEFGVCAQIIVPPQADTGLGDPSASGRILSAAEP